MRPMSLLSTQAWLSEEVACIRSKADSRLKELSFLIEEDLQWLEDCRQDALSDIRSTAIIESSCARDLRVPMREVTNVKLHLSRFC